MFFSGDEQKKQGEAHPEYTFGELAKAVSVRWKEMTVDDKAPFEEKAAADKARYTEAMKTYVRPAHFDEGDDSDEGGGKKAKGKGKGNRS